MHGKVVAAIAATSFIALAKPGRGSVVNARKPKTGDSIAIACQPFESTAAITDSEYFSGKNGPSSLCILYRNRSFRGIREVMEYEKK
jgi:hypothetical protein